MAKFHVGQKVETVVGSTGKVTAVDPARGKVAVKATTNDSLHHNKGEEKVFFEAEVRPA